MAQKMVPDRERLSFCSETPEFNYSFSSASLIIEDKAASSCLWEFLQGTRDSPSMHPYFGRKTSITAGNKAGNPPCCPQAEQEHPQPAHLPRWSWCSCQAQGGDAGAVVWQRAGAARMSLGAWGSRGQ